ncbi:thioesterase II family protein [Myceligenerans indicum]|uniref:Thioesterase n=1 Tax=Myceligenerans indicum TaxID=2593663 RepID=A0ABS1LQ14_9MICO|nr:alpha/beta fold hydrolase [Myceligenerans indicum]MBL0888361.1 thioesterase [Myceligenerans indicum]
MLLFCFSYAGGVATTLYESWPALLGPEHTVIPVDYPGRGSRAAEPLAATPQDLVDDAFATVSRHAGSEASWGVFGHSMGAMVAHRVAARAEREPGLRPPRIAFVSGRRPPGDRPVSPVPADSPDRLLEHATTWGGIPADIAARPHLARPLLRGLADDIRVSHDPDAPAATMTTPLHVMWSAEDPLTDANQIGRWALMSYGTVAFHRFEGDHFFLGPGARHALPLVRAVVDASGVHHTEDARQEAREPSLQIR